MIDRMKEGAAEAMRDPVAALPVRRFARRVQEWS